ncbi:MAG TPA: 4Fe-4S dicluster domain-containing protein [Deltaproteobacteria bacterium]|nr:4Fe-4S dicluster domain-containing protein [Deltaproteobacteria bacterium]
MDKYEELRQNLHKNPSGAPKSESFDEILRILFTPEEVEVACEMSFVPKSIEKIAEKAGVSIERTSELCESMANKGIIFSREKNNKMRYSLLPTIPGLFEFPYMRGDGTPMHDRLAGLWEDYHVECQGAEFGSSPTPLARIIAVEETISSENEVLPYEVLSQMMENNTRFALAHCACRVAAGANSCDKPTEVCLIFDQAADFLIKRGFGKEITRDEALNVLRTSEEAGLVHTANNSQDRLSFICNCCSCCCTILTCLTRINAPYPFATSRWIAQVDETCCTGCSICSDERCPVSAIAIHEQSAVVDVDRCIGCGLCASACPEDAVTMNPRTGAVTPPATMLELGAQILKEKGRFEEFMELNTP